MIVTIEIPEDIATHLKSTECAAHLMQPCGYAETVMARVSAAVHNPERLPTGALAEIQVRATVAFVDYLDTATETLTARAETMADRASRTAMTRATTMRWVSQRLREIVGNEGGA